MLRAQQLYLEFPNDGVLKSATTSAIDKVSVQALTEQGVKENRVWSRWSMRLPTKEVRMFQKTHPSATLPRFPSLALFNPTRLKAELFRQ